MMPVAAGEPLIALFCLAYPANRPVLLDGRHGVGKSEIARQAAQRLGIKFLVRDLSLMEPPDLVGLPIIGNDDGRTRYAPPAFLPSNGKGILLLEELNRAEKYMRAPCLQLLTDRCLNDYMRTKGWLPCAAVNSVSVEDGLEYQVDELDPALRARFLEVQVVPDVRGWASWARENGSVHPTIIQFVENSPETFEDPTANPRAWTYASDLVKSWELSDDRDRGLLLTCLAGTIGNDWAAAFVGAYTACDQPFKAEDVLVRYPNLRQVVKQWIDSTRLDLIQASLKAVQRHIQPQRVYDDVIADSTRKRNLEMFFSDLPADLKRQTQRWLKDRGFSGLSVPRAGRR
jgi:hypothetical protein